VYNDSHYYEYRSLPINLFSAYADPETGIYTKWFVRDHELEHEQIRCFLRHQHETLELILVQKGRLDACLEKASLAIGAGELMIVNPYIEHSGDYSTDTGVLQYLCIQIELGFFVPAVQCGLRECLNRILLGTGHFTEHISADHPAMPALEAAMNRLMQLWDDKACPYNDSQQMSVVYELLSQLILHCYVERPLIEIGSRDMRFIRRVTAYLNEHYADELSTAAVSEAMSYNLNHFCRLFHENFGTNFSHYLCEFRIARSQTFYQNSSLHINEIASAVGFRDYGYFAKEFKKYTGITPTAFFLGRGK